MRNIAALTILIGVFAIPTSGVMGQAWKSQIGFTDLVAEKGAALEDGSGLKVMIAEAPSTAGNYMPDVNDAQFSGKTIVNQSGGSNTANGHGTRVGKHFFGNTSSLSPGITDISVYDANGYIGNVLGFNTGNDPLADAYAIGNHSYVGAASGTFTAAVAEDILERFDFVINRDNTVMVVGANNGNTTPRIFAPSYNAITVGQTNGTHSQTLTPNYGAPRFATHIVVPDADFTSYATPVVSSAAAILRDAGTGSNFEQNEVIRAALFAGATKEEFAGWDRTSTRPMDEVFGFGELNILNSYHIFEGGEFEGATSDPATDVGLLGWDYGMFDGATDLFYDFTIAPTETGTISAVLSWNMEITDNDAGAVFDASRHLADLNLELFDSSGSFMGTLIDSSNGTDYNNEHIFNTVSAGNYTFRISGDSATDFGFAWNIVSAVPEPSSTGVLALIALGCLGRRKRRA